MRDEDKTAGRMHRVFGATRKSPDFIGEMTESQSDHQTR